MQEEDPEEYSFAAIGRRLRLTRTVLDLDQEQFAKQAKISRTAYNGYENGKKRPSVDNAIRLCDRYNLTLDWIYRGEPSGLPPALHRAIDRLLEARETKPNR